MKALTKITALLALSMGVLAACGESSVSSSEPVNYAQEAIDSAICLEDSNGSVILPSTTPLIYGNSIDLVKKFYITEINTTVNLTWVSDNDANWTLVDSEDGSYMVATAVRPGSALAADVPATWTVTASVNMKSATATYNFVLVRMTVTEEYGLELTPLSEVRTLAVKTKLRTQGYVTAIYPDGNGFYIQEGAYGIFIYYGTGVAIGDYVSVTGMITIYSGLAEISRVSSKDPLIIKKIAIPTGALPVPNVVTSATFNATGLKDLDGSLVHIEGLTYVSGAITVGSHSTIMLDLGGVSVPVYDNYHTGTANQTAVKALFDGLVAGDTLTYDGLLTWYDVPQLGPVAASDFTVVHAS